MAEGIIKEYGLNYETKSKTIERQKACREKKDRGLYHIQDPKEQPGTNDKMFDTQV